MYSTSFSCVLGFIIASIYLTDGKSCPETLSLPNLKDMRLPVYQEMATFPCGGHMIGWRTVGIIPTHSLYIGVWIPNHGSQKLLTLLEPVNKVRDDGMEPLIVESGDFLGLVLLNDSSLPLTKFARLTPGTTTDHSNNNDFLVAVVPRDTIRGSVINFKETSFLRIPSEFTLIVQMDYSGTHKAKWESSKKLSKRDKSKKCNPRLPNCETCSKVKGQLVCSSCHEGFYGQTCKDACPESCAACDQHTGDCTGCAAGYFGTNCKELCPSGCSPSLGCNADSGCTQCRLGWEGKWCKEFITSCNEGRFRGSNCKDKCPQNCEPCNRTHFDNNCLFCKQGIQWQLCTDNLQNEGAVGYAEEENSTLGAALGAVFAVLILGAILGGIAFYLIRRKRRALLVRREAEMAAQNGLPSREALEERQSNLYVQGLPKTTANQNRQLPLPPDEDEEGYMAPSHLAKSDVTSPLLRGEEQRKDEKSPSPAPDKSSPPKDDVYEAIGDVEPIEETFE